LSITRRIAKNVAVLTLSDIFQKILSFILVIYIARILGDVNFGKYSFAFSFCSLFLILSDLGISQYMIREVARNKMLTSKFMGNVAIIKILLSIATYAFIVILMNWMDYPADTRIVVYVIGLSLIIGSFSRVFNSIFTAFEEMEYNALLATLEKIVVTIGGIYILFAGYGLVHFAFIFLAGSIFGLAGSVTVATRKFAKPNFEVDGLFCRRIIKESLPFALSWVFISIYFYINIVILSKMKGDEVVGWYNAAYNLISALIFIPSIFTTVVFPTLSFLYSFSQGSLRLAYSKSFKYLLSISMPVVCGTILLAPNFIYFIYGSEFSNSINALRILIVAFVFICIDAILQTVLNAMNMQTLVMKVTGIAALTSVLLNLLLIPIFSLYGASIATVLTEVVLFIAYFYFVSKYLCPISPRETIIKPLIATFVMGIFIYTFINYNILILISAAGVIYFGVLYILGGLSEDDWYLLKQIFKPEKKG
jgi:O-antigen/teichoic acid export membrane protein